MTLMRCIVGIVVLLSISVWCVSADLGDDLEAEKVSVSERLREVEQDLNQALDPDVAVELEGGDIAVSSEEDRVSVSTEEDSLSVSERLELVNKDLEGDEDSVIEDGDVAVPRSRVQKRNADRCVTRGCKWPRSSNKKVYVPYVIANHYSSSQLAKIKQAFTTFSKATCIRFVPRSSQHNYLYIFSSTGSRKLSRVRPGLYLEWDVQTRPHLYSVFPADKSHICWSYIGRQKGKQPLSLKKNGCIYLGTIQHELLHALGFHHEHKRSDRDDYIQVLWDNIIKGKEHNFKKKNTLNQGTPYDYSSVMHYSRTAFSKNGKPVLVACRKNVSFGRASRMSSCDIERVNRLYCR